MEQKQLVHQNVNPTEYELIKRDLALDGYDVVATGIDTFTVVALRASYNRNQHVLTMNYQEGDTTIEEIVDRDDDSEKINATPVQTEVDKHGNIVPPVVEEPVGTTPAVDSTPPVTTEPPASTPPVEPVEPVETQESAPPSTVATPPTVTPTPANS